MLTIDQMRNRKAIEALRAGVPNGDAVSALGCDQPGIEKKFRERLKQVKVGVPSDAPQSLLIEGDFGTGKSHLLEYLQHVALAENFVCSKIVISKETPLHDPRKLFVAAVENAIVPNKRGDVLTLVASEINPKEPEYELVYKYVSRNRHFDQRFLATFKLFGSVNRTDEIMNRIFRFWAGDPLSVSELKRDLRNCNESRDYSFGKTTLKELAIQRFDFASQLICAAGYAGWALLIDEVELIGRYSRLQRAKSYSEITRWIDTGHKYIVPVLAITEDFKGAVLGDKGDRDGMMDALRDRWGIDAAFIRQVSRGIRIIDNEAVSLLPFNNLETLYEKVRLIYGIAYGFAPPEVTGTPNLSSTAIREYIKAWITEWDLKRLDSNYSVELTVDKLKSEYEEETEI